MPCSYRVVGNGSLVIERWSGAVTHEELIAHKRQLALEPSIRKGAAVLTDCRAAAFATPVNMLHEVAAVDGDPANHTRIGRYAFLVEEPAYERAQLFASQVSRYGVTVIVFTSLSVACQWLGVDAVDVQALITAMDTGTRA